MKKLRFSISDKLHDELVKTAKQLRIYRPDFYEKCLADGLDYQLRLIEQGEDHDFIIAVANAIIKKSDQSEESQQDLYFDFNYKGLTVLIDSKVQYLYSLVEGGDTAPSSNFVSLFYNGEFYVSDADGNEVKRFDHIEDHQIEQTLKNILG
jgi:hypothetical protein